MSELPSRRLEELFLRHADAAGRLAYLLTGDRDLADDLVQDAFVRVARRLVHHAVTHHTLPKHLEPRLIALRDPKVDEFMHFILSQEGQQEVQREGRYMPLTAEVVWEQLKKLNRFSRQ